MKSLKLDRVVLPDGVTCVPAGSFLMGSEDPDASPYERPIHEVWLNAYAMKATPVTNAEFATFVDQTGYVTSAELLRGPRGPQESSEGEQPCWTSHVGPGRGTHPVVCVSWFDARAYLNWYSEHIGAECRLPSEAEWEKAARGGRVQELFPWGSDAPENRACWDRWRESIGTLPVGSFAPNGYGLYDMAGNAWEWCADWYDDDFYALCASTGVVHNPCGPDQGTLRARRGASWNIGEPFRMRCANRGAMNPAQSWPNLGFRYVISP